MPLHFNELPIIFIYIFPGTSYVVVIARSHYSCWVFNVEMLPEYAGYFIDFGSILNYRCQYFAECVPNPM